MSRFRHDQFAKELLAGLLETVGLPKTEVQVTSEVRHIDLLFAPLPEKAEQRQRLGLLGRIATTSCLLEPYRNPPSPEEIRSCAMKVFIQHGEQQRQARRDDQPLRETDYEVLWVIGPTISEAALGAFKAESEDGWEQGIYFTGTGWRTVLVAVHQLPLGRETLWLRILGRGRVQQQAINEVLALEEEDPLRELALRLLASWRIRTQQQSELSPEDQELAMNLSTAYLEWEQKTLQQGERRVLVRQLTNRFGPLSQEVVSRLEAITDAVKLEELADAVLVVTDLQSFQQLLEDGSPATSG